MREFTIQTGSHTEFVNIDSRIQEIVDEERVADGICHVFVPHTTAAVTVNENADPDVRSDMEMILDRAVPWTGGYAHAEGNAAAHLKASMMGSGETLFIQDGRLVLGTWQSVFFCEFDGPRRRKVWVRVSPD